MVEKATRVMHFNDGLPSMHITGWVLTHLGRMTYCQACSDEVIKDDLDKEDAL